MPRVPARRSVVALLLAGFASLLLCACGSGSSGSASTLLKQTFGGHHAVNSGRLTFALSITPSGSSTLTQPVTLSFGGPFQSRGTGKLPASDFAIGVSAEGYSGSLSLISTGTQGFVNLSGTSYQLPASDFQQLESRFASVATSGSGGSKSQSGVLGKLGIDPLGWLSDPSVVGSATVGGAPTTHLRAAVNVPRLLADINTALGRAGTTGVAGTSKLPKSLSAATRQRIARDVRHPTLDVWTGTSDKTLRRLVLRATLPVSGRVSAALGGLKTAGITLELQYSDVNVPQTIAAPTATAPYSQFQTKLADLLREIETVFAAGASGTGTTSTGTGATSTGTGATGAGAGGGGGSAGATGSGSSGVAAYNQCVAQAGSSLTNLQKCSSLLSGSGAG